MKPTANYKKHLEKSENLQPASVMYRLLSSSAGTSELHYGFDTDTNKENDLTNDKQPGSIGFFIIEYV